MSILNAQTVNLTEFLNLPALTTGQRNALTGLQSGTIIFNVTTLQVELYTGTAWKPVGATGGALYDFTTHTFRSIISQGVAIGPSQSAIQSAYTSVTWAATYIKQGASQGYQRWTVPVDGVYTIEAGGAAGGKDPNTSVARAYGATIRGNFTLLKDQLIDIAVGSMGNEYSSPHYNEAGGGGGTFVKNHTTNTLLLVAGGAGGTPSSSYGTSCGRNISQGHGQSGQASGNDACASTPSTPTAGNGGNTAGSYQGGAGGGYNSDGQNGGTHCATSIGGKSYTNGLRGGTGNTCYSSGGEGNRGGFGGGGGGQLSGPGGGGGYTGGNCSGQWSSYSSYGGGGGSYNVGASASNTSGTNTGSTGGYPGSGYCKITKV